MEWKYLRGMGIALAAALALGLTGCGGGGGGTAEAPPPVVEPEPIDVERTAIASAIAAAQAAAGMVSDTSDDATVAAADTAIAAAMAAINGATLISSGEAGAARTQLAAIQSALSVATASRTAAMEIASQRTAISVAIAAAAAAVEAVNDESDDATVQAARDALQAADLAIVDAGDLTQSEVQAEGRKVSALRAALHTAEVSRQAAMDAADEAERERRMAEARRTTQLQVIADAIDAATTAVGMVNDGSTQEQVDAANDAVANARAKIAEAADVSEDVLATHTASVDTLASSLANAQESWQTAQDDAADLDRQRAEISGAIDTARTAVEGINNDSTDEQVEAATQAIADARVAIAEQDDVPDAEKDANNATLDAIMVSLNTAKDSRMAAIEDREEEAEDQRMAAAATAAALYDAIAIPTPPALSTTDRPVRHAGYATDGSSIGVQLANGTSSPFPLKEDKETTVDPHHGWEGKRWTLHEGGADYEAIVYSNVGEPKPGKKFSAEYPDTETFVTDGVVTIDTSGTDTPPSLVDSPSFDQPAGSKEFPKGENEVAVMIPGTFHDVSGTYSCTPAADNTCAAQVAAKGFTLGGTADATNLFTTAGGTWTFKPTDADARVTGVPDADYASYGWWTYKHNDGTFHASAFHVEKGAALGGTDPLQDLRGTARYVGGAAGKYALTSSTGGTNDAGHFTADATLEATFADSDSGGTSGHTISGTIDNFTGGDGKPRDGWSVQLKELAVGENGNFGVTNKPTTAWTIDGTAADDSGEWRGNLYEMGDDGVPKVAAGTFYTEYGMDGKMVGGFGANKQ